MKVHAIIHIIEVGIGNVTSAVLKLKRKTVACSSVWLPLGWDDILRHGWMRGKTRCAIKLSTMWELYKQNAMSLRPTTKGYQCHQEYELSHAEAIVAVQSTFRYKFGGISQTCPRAH